MAKELFVLCNSWLGAGIGVGTTFYQGHCLGLRFCIVRELPDDCDDIAAAPQTSP